MFLNKGNHRLPNSRLPEPTRSNVEFLFQEPLTSLTSRGARTSHAVLIDPHCYHNQTILSYLFLFISFLFFSLLPVEVGMSEFEHKPISLPCQHTVARVPSPLPLAVCYTTPV